ncbi:MAG: DUF4190 domain-containing protein [Ktedonobacterales bacterium]
MSDPYGMEYPTAHRGDDDFRPPYTQDPPYPPPPYPPYGQPTAAAAPGQSNASPGVQPVYVPYAVAVPGSGPGDGMALTSMILGIISAAIGWIPFCGVVVLAPAIVGIVLGALGLKSQNRRGMAIAGIILSVVGIALATVFIWI